VPVTSPLREGTRVPLRASPSRDLRERVAGEAEPPSLAPTPVPVSLAELHDRLRGKRFGEKVHLVFEAYPPVTDPWPPPGRPFR